ncbi:type IV secretory system conjugative DNA transfer family protein [Desulfallas thermosapovorans]|uniref:Type IV secretory system conjugative DNA transfer VirD4/TraG family protein n=1 Tax=Desulfallas thermosapovorans DSM 6562 TaxID=1121431 RepID=A0A5S4ZPN5_9FIRM|nr:TraM recognition domain-containing protein [Desulfallas thermosapovorans]TYO94514.1 type IV secretory system conjugative DNA transfer VirD4/TraG family protein [Desulfallas thermosapovorans DSM 6562]
MFENLRDRFGKIPAKYQWAVIAGLAFMGAAAILILDVWLLGTAAAWLHCAVTKLGSVSIFATEAEKAAGTNAFDAVGWYWHHPFFVAKAWLFEADKLSNPEVRTYWLFLNAGLGILGLIGATAGKIQIKKRKNNTEHRDIRKLKFKNVRYDINRYLEKTPENRYFLGLDDRRRPVNVSVSDMFEHIHILGGSGSGKTAFGVTPICIQAIRKGAALVAIDFKGDRQAIQLLAREAAANNKRFYIFTLDQREKSNTYNPLATGTPLGKAERIMTALELVFEGEARFYTYVQKATFIPLLAALDAQGVSYTLSDIYEILQNPKLVFKLTGQQVDENQIKGLTAALLPFAEIEQINFAQSDINLTEIMGNGDVVYFDLQSALAPEASSALGKMIAQDLQYLSAPRTQQSRPVVIAIDEFQNMACLAFRNIISKVRSKNYALILANQAMGDLMAVSDDFTNTIQVNTRTKIIFNADTPADAELFSQYTGTVLQTVMNHSKNKTQTHGLMPGWFKDDQRQTTGESKTEIEVPLLHPNLFKAMPPGKSVVIRRGQLATMANHAYLISEAEKDRLEQLPLPEPVFILRDDRSVFMMDDMLKNAKIKLAKQSDQSGNPLQPDNQNKDETPNAGKNEGAAEASEIAL